jgi:Zn finger protein HypA/HybF involved in hydrogenase expression
MDREDVRVIGEAAAKVGEAVTPKDTVVVIKTENRGKCPHCESEITEKDIFCPTCKKKVI